MFIIISSLYIEAMQEYNSHGMMFMNLLKHLFVSCLPTANDLPYSPDESDWNKY